MGDVAGKGFDAAEEGAVGGGDEALWINDGECVDRVGGEVGALGEGAGDGVAELEAAHDGEVGGRELQFDGGGDAIRGELGGIEALPEAVREGVGAQVALVLGRRVEAQGEDEGALDVIGDDDVIDGADGLEVVGDVGQAFAQLRADAQTGDLVADHLAHGEVVGVGFVVEQCDGRNEEHHESDGEPDDRQADQDQAAIGAMAACRARRIAALGLARRGRRPTLRADAAGPSSLEGAFTHR